MRTTWQAQLSRHVRAITLTMSVSLLLAGSALPQMAPQFTASLSASLVWPEVSRFRRRDRRGSFRRRRRGRRLSSGELCRPR